MADVPPPVAGSHVLSLVGSSLLGGSCGPLFLAAWRTGDPAGVLMALMKGEYRAVLMGGLGIGFVAGLFVFMAMDILREDRRRVPRTWWGWAVTGLLGGGGCSILLLRQMQA